MPHAPEARDDNVGPKDDPMGLKAPGMLGEEPTDVLGKGLPTDDNDDEMPLH